MNLNYFLAKTEPDNYSIDNLRRDLSTIWDGIKNPQALRAVRAMRSGDRVFIYHSGKAPAVAGLAEVASDPRPDPRDAKSFVVELRYLSHLTPPTTLAELKSAGRFDGWALIRQPRLSTMEAPAEFVEWMRDRYPGVRV
jgi:predicted RNA-binding protein with PUA-like domain